MSQLKSKRDTVERRSLLQQQFDVFGADGRKRRKRRGMSMWKGCPDLGALRQFRYKKKFLPKTARTERKTKRRNGGEDIILKVPVGTVLHNSDAGKRQGNNQSGRKNFDCRRRFGVPRQLSFPFGQNTSPRQFQPGLPGEAFTLAWSLSLSPMSALSGIRTLGNLACSTS